MGSIRRSQKTIEKSWKAVKRIKVSEHHGLRKNISRGFDIAMEIDRLVQAEKGLVSGRIFADEDIYELELERLFARCWLYLGHETQIPKPGDYITTYMGEDPVILWRDSEGKVGAFLNSCRHRGMRVSRLDEGNANFLTCPYHGWAFSNQGKLVTVPEYREGYLEELNKEEWGLIPVAKVAAYKGLIFGTFDEGAETLDEYLGDIRWYLDLMVDRTDGGLEVLPGVHKWTIPANWKFAADNFVGDSYHVARTHRSAIELGIQPPISNMGHMISPGKGHGYDLNMLQMEGGWRDLAKGIPREVLPYMHYLEEHREEAKRILGRERAWILQNLFAAHSTVFPNLSTLDLPRYLTFRVWHPRGPYHIEVWSWCLVERGMPEKVREMVCRAYLTQFGPAGTFEQDDAELWSQCTETARGWVCRQHPLNYQMGLGHEETHETMPGRMGPALSEINQRGFYRRWAELMHKNGKGGTA
jgi:phenylpropionate dioxygenase-like ring-hydroxylating dioxygenase large terminal subunit